MTPFLSTFPIRTLCKIGGNTIATRTDEKLPSAVKSPIVLPTRERESQSINQSINGSLIQSMIHSFNQWFAHSFNQWFIQSVTNSFTHSFIHSFNNSIIHSFNNSFIHSIIHSFIHSIVHSIIGGILNPSRSLKNGKIAATTEMSRISTVRKRM